jgi:hypothetical protein
MWLRRVFIDQVIWTATAMDTDRFYFLVSFLHILKKARQRTCSLQAGAHLWSHLCHLPTGLGTAPTLIRAGSQLGIGAFAYLITGNCALVAHISANSADGCGDGGIPQHEIFAELADLGAVL